MISKNEIIESADEKSVEPRIVEKDYVLGWVLAALNNINSTKDRWIFKGGTCLKKCYFDDYRYSEDLDFTVMDSQQLNQSSLMLILEEIIDWLNQYTGIEILKHRTIIKINEGDIEGRRYAGMRIYYIGPLEQRRNPEKIIFDLSGFEQLFTIPERRVIFHNFSDLNQDVFYAASYCFEELFAEKLRVLVERARPRDLYDIIHLYDKRNLLRNETDYMHLLRQKFARKNVSFKYLWEFYDHPKYQELLNEWTNMLAHQLANLDQIEEYLKKLHIVQEWILVLEKSSIMLPQSIDENNVTTKIDKGEYVIKFYSKNNKLYHAIISQKIIDDKLLDTTNFINTEQRQKSSKDIIIKYWPGLVSIIRKNLTLNIVKNKLHQGEFIIKVELLQEDLSDVMSLKTA